MRMVDMILENSVMSVGMYLQECIRTVESPKKSSCTYLLAVAFHLRSVWITQCQRIWSLLMLLAGKWSKEWPTLMIIINDFYLFVIWVLPWAGILGYSRLNWVVSASLRFLKNFSSLMSPSKYALTSVASQYWRLTYNIEYIDNS